MQTPDELRHAFEDTGREQRFGRGRLAADELGDERADARELGLDARGDAEIGGEGGRRGFAGAIDAEQLRALARQAHHERVAVDLDDGSCGW